MAVIKLNYSTSPAAAKQTVRYIVHRRDRDGHTMSRRLFGLEGTMRRQDAYELIDLMDRQGKPLYYRIVISPDPKRDDSVHRDLSLEDVTHATMHAISRSCGPVVWVAAIHAADHTDIRHIHCLAILPRKLTKDELQAARAAATGECQLQRRELDAYRQAEQDRIWEEEAQWDYSYPF
jgi:hypothetical protein